MVQQPSPKSVALGEVALRLGPAVMSQENTRSTTLCRLHSVFDRRTDRIPRSARACPDDLAGISPIDPPREVGIAAVAQNPLGADSSIVGDVACIPTKQTLSRSEGLINFLGARAKGDCVQMRGRSVSTPAKMVRFLDYCNWH